MTRASLRNIFDNANVVSEELVDEVFTELKRPGTGKAFIPFQKSEISWNGLRTVYVERLHEITAPTLIMHGAKDRLVPLDCARQAHEVIQESQLHVIADCGHWPQREKPEEFNRVLLNFLCSEEARP
jgi:pimeloyl-ACP methyl ester carboxylesterase